MIPPQDDERVDAYLWDPAAPVADEVRFAESTLAALRFDPEAHRLELPAATMRARHLRTWRYVLAAAASVVLIAGVWTSYWRWQWPTGQAWTIAAGPSAAPDQLAVGVPLVVEGLDEARIRIARVGTMSVTNNARLTLESTNRSRHRLVLDRGAMHVRVWAPPASVNVRTPAGEVIDLGCEFDLNVDAAGTSSVLVRSGWVMIANGAGETLIPAGAGASMRPGQRPGAPVFSSAAPEFVRAVRSIETASGDAGADVNAIVSHARVSDVLTMFVLIDRRTPGSDRIGVRAAELVPLPPGVTLGDIRQGNEEARERWRDMLRLPPPKGWLRNWRDALPAWLLPSDR